MPYNFRQIPEVGTVEELRQWLSEELKQLSQSLNESIELELRASKHEPDNPREGMIIHADGGAWNPGNGAGTYRYQNGVWVKIPDSAGDLGSLFGYGRVRGVSTNTILVRSDSGQAIEAGATLTITLPTCTGNIGVNFAIVNTGVGTVTVNTSTGSEVIDLLDNTFPTSVALSGGQRMTFYCDGANWVTVAANFRVAFPQGNGIISDQTSLRTVQQMSITVDGSGLKLSGDAASPGNSQYYGTNSGGTKGYNALPASGGLTLLSSAGVGTGTTYSVTGLSGYKMFFVIMRGISHNSGASESFRVALSGNNGSSYGSALTPQLTTFAAATIVNGSFWIDRIDQTNNQGAIPQGQAGGATNIDTSSLGPVNALQFSWSGGSFDAGEIDIYGDK